MDKGPPLLSPAKPGAPQAAPDMLTATRPALQTASAHIKQCADTNAGTAAALLCLFARPRCALPPIHSQSHSNGLLSVSVDAHSANVCFMHANERTSKNRFTSGSAQR